MNRIFRNRLALTTILAAAPFLGYGRQAVAACAPNPVAPTYSCSGASGAQVINFNDAYVTTQPGFSVTTAAGNGITITGDGHLRYIDTNASPVTSTSPAGDGISVHSGGDDNDVPGAVTISTAGAITGGARGIHARNDGEGNLSVTANGAVTGNTGDGIYAQNYGTDLTIVTGAGSEIDGGDEGIDAVNQGSGKLDITANGTVTGANDGLLAYNSGDGTDLLITTGAGSGIEGGDSGIYADNQGSGRLEITANGKVTGGDRDGIYGRNDGGDLIITANAGSEIDGGDEGIDAVNNGSGELRVTADGKVTGANDGLLAFNSGNGTHLRIVTGAQSEITGGNSGIFADNYGKGDLDIKAYGKVTGNDGDGIYARNSYDTDNGVDLKIVTGAQSSVTGSKYGINAKSYGTGDLVIRADGAVTGETEDGIFAHAYYGRNLTITTGAGSDISGSDDGIDAENTGIGDLTITVGGKVTGIGSDGIDALNEGVDLTITAEAGSVINAEYEGIQGDNRGTGNLTIIANGAITTISGGGNGIDAQNGYDGMDLTITTGAGSSISAGDDGIYAENRGLGNLTITVDGSVEGRGDDGIYADNEGANLTITTVAGSVVKGEDDGIDARHARSDGTFQVMVNGSVTGTEGYGINAANRADAFTDIKVSGSGLVQGNQAAIFAKSNAERDISITNDGIVRNLSGKSFDVAIRTTGGATTVDNANQLIGTVQTGSFDDTVNNTGQWSIAGGTSNFGFEDEGDVVNNSGVLIAAVDPAGFGEETLIEDLEIFNNSGIVTLVDGAERDRLRFDEDATFNGQGGRLAIDAFLAGPIAGRSDMLFVDGDVSGVTYLTVNLTNPLGSTPNYEGIPVVVVAGDRAPESFALQDGVLNAGFFAWGLELNLDAYELVTLGLGAGAHEFAAGITGAQDMWQQTTGTLLQRQADLRPLIAAQQVTPVADFVTPVEPTPVGRVTPGLWFKGVGG
ncbi:MAG: beta strand repeat-containing protein, partial [Pseudomonadota bacterium]